MTTFHPEPSPLHPAIGLSTGSLYPHEATEAAVETIAALGFETCECYFQAHSENLPPFHRELAAALRRAGLAIHSVHLDVRYFDFFGPYVRRRQDAFDLFARAIDGAAALGARCLNWHGPTQEEMGRGATLAAAVEVVGRLGERAQAAGVLLTLENVSWCAIRTAADVAWWQAQRLPIGFCYDPFQAAEAAADPVALLATMGADLATVHASDFRQGGPRHLPPGQGDLPWQAIAATLRGLRYPGPIIIEPAHLAPGDHAPLTAAAAFVRHLFE